MKRRVLKIFNQPHIAKKPQHIVGAFNLIRSIMRRKTSSSWLHYLGIIAFILGWWILAFTKASPKNQYLYSSSLPRHVNTASSTVTVSPLFAFDRDTLLRALNGNIPTMRKLIIEWDIDAQLLEAEGLVGIKRLSSEDFRKAQHLGRLLQDGSPQEIDEATQYQHVPYVVDDIGTMVDSTLKSSRFLPQTYAAASILLAVAPPEQIIAIPRGMRYYSQLYPNNAMNSIPFNSDRYNTEQLSLEKPELAFISHYSDPSTVRTLKNQGIKLFTTVNVNTISQIIDTVQRIGAVVHSPLQSQLLALFIEAAMLAIDNQLLAQRKDAHSLMNLRTPLYLTYVTHFTTPSSETLTADLIKRLGINQTDFLTNNNFPKLKIINHEELVTINPDCLIISCANNILLQETLLATPALQHIDAFKYGRIFFVDEHVQHSPSQYLVLAYYDIFNALMGRRES